VWVLLMVWIPTRELWCGSRSRIGNAHEGVAIDFSKTADTVRRVAKVRVKVAADVSLVAEMHDWRWIDKGAGTWEGWIEFRMPALYKDRWISGDRISPPQSGGLASPVGVPPTSWQTVSR